MNAVIRFQEKPCPREKGKKKKKEDMFQWNQGRKWAPGVMLLLCRAPIPRRETSAGRRPPARQDAKKNARILRDEPGKAHRFANNYPPMLSPTVWLALSPYR